MDECNAAEDDEHGDDDGSGGLPAELQDREQRVAKLRAVREQLEAERGSDLKPKSQKSFADPDANMYILKVDLQQAEQIYHVVQVAPDSFSLALRPDEDTRAADPTEYGTTTDRLIMTYLFPVPQLVDLSQLLGGQPLPTPGVPLPTPSAAPAEPSPSPTAAP